MLRTCTLRPLVSGAVFCTCTALAMLGACTFTGPESSPSSSASSSSSSASSPGGVAGLSPHETGVLRLQQIDARIDNLNRRIDMRIGKTGARADDLRQKLEAVRTAAHNVASQNNGELTIDQQTGFNEQIMPISQTINR